MNVQSDNKNQSGFVITVVILLIALLTLRYAFEIDVLTYLKPVWEWLREAIGKLGLGFR